MSTSDPVRAHFLSFRLGQRVRFDSAFDGTIVFIDGQDAYDNEHFLIEMRVQYTDKTGTPRSKTFSPREAFRAIKPQKE